MERAVTGAVDHVGVAVPDLEAALPLWTGVLGMRAVHEETVAGHGVREAMLVSGRSSTAVQLVAPLSDDSPVGRFLARRGPGLHHLALRVDDIDEALQRLREQGIEPVPPGVSTGTAGSRVAFLPPGALGGVLVELVQPATPRDPRDGQGAA